MPPSPDPDLIAPGAPAAEFALSDQAGKTHRLSDYRGRWVVLYFYPKDSTPGCTNEACQFRDRFEGLTDRGAAVLGVSPDPPESHAKFAGKHDLPFPLLSDADHAVCKAYGVWRSKSMFGRRYMGVVRATYLIGPDGLVAHVWPRVRVLGHARDVLRTLDSFMRA